MTVSSKDLISVLRVLELVPSRAGIPSSEFIRLQSKNGSLYLSLTSEVFGVVKVTATDPKEWTAYVDRSSFIPFVNVSKDVTPKTPFQFTCLPKHHTLVVRCGSRKGVFNELVVVSGYSEVGKLSGSKLTLTTDQRKALVLAALYATPDPTMAKLNCVYVQETGWILASNERAAIRIQDPNISATVPLPLGLLNSISDSTVKSIVVGKDLAKVYYPFGYLCQTINQYSAKQFPKKAIHTAMEAAKKYPKAFTVSTELLVSALERLSVYSSMVVKRDTIVELSGTAKDTDIKLTCKVPQGQFEERVVIKEPLKKDVSMEWLLQLLIPLSGISKSISKITVQYEPDTLSPYYIKAKGLDLLVSRRAV